MTKEEIHHVMDCVTKEMAETYYKSYGMTEEDVQYYGNKLDTPRLEINDPFFELVTLTEDGYKVITDDEFRED